MGACPHLLLDRTPFLFDPQEACASCTCADREVLLDLRSVCLVSLLQQSSASATSFVLGVSGWDQSFSFTPLDKHQLSSPGAHVSPISITLPPSVYNGHLTYGAAHHGAEVKPSVVHAARLPTEFKSRLFASWAVSLTGWLTSLCLGFFPCTRHTEPQSWPQGIPRFHRTLYLEQCLVCKSNCTGSCCYWHWYLTLKGKIRFLK